MKDKRFALLVGINYRKTSSELAGCINDVKDVNKLLKDKFNYRDSNITILTEDATPPTKDNIIKNLTNLVLKTVKGEADSIFFHYSGHGSYIRDINGDEKDGRDEVLCPLDYEKKGFITDDNLNSIIKLMPKETSFFALLDCCHSGTMFDLKFNHLHGDERVTEERKALKIESHVIAYSGCLDKQTSADAWINGRFNGAMTKSFLESLKKNNYNITYFELLKDMRSYLNKNKYSQKPQLTCSLKLDKDDYFCKSNRRTLFWSF